MYKGKIETPNTHILIHDPSHSCLGWGISVKSSGVKVENI
jgi:hypothetical protein